MDLGNELFICSQEVYFGVYFPSCEAMREINTKIVLIWTHKQFVMKVHTLFHFLHDIILYVAIKYNLPTSPLCLACPVYILLMTSQSVADGVIMTRQLWCKNVTTDIYRKISNVRFTFADNIFVDHSDVDGASPVSAAPTTSWFPT